MLCALFEDKPRAAAAMDALVNGAVGEQLVSVVMHEGSVTHEDLGVAAGRSGRRMLLGAVIGVVGGGAVGAVLGFVFTPGAAALGPLLGAVVVGGLVGAAYTALAGVIAGRDSDAPVLEDLSPAFEAGKVLVTLEVHGPASVRKEAHEILTRFGGRPIDAEPGALSAAPIASTSTGST